MRVAHTSLIRLYYRVLLNEITSNQKFDSFDLIHTLTLIHWAVSDVSSWYHNDILCVLCAVAKRIQWCISYPNRFPRGSVAATLWWASDKAISSRRILERSIQRGWDNARISKMHIIILTCLSGHCRNTYGRPCTKFGCHDSLVPSISNHKRK